VWWARLSVAPSELSSAESPVPWLAVDLVQPSAKPPSTRSDFSF
jgi:hypothetical protein